MQRYTEILPIVLINRDFCQWYFVKKILSRFIPLERRRRANWTSKDSKINETRAEISVEKRAKIFAAASSFHIPCRTNTTSSLELS